MTLLIALLSRLGLPEEFRRLAACAVLAIAALAGLLVLKGCYDRAVIARHQAGVEASGSAARDAAEIERADDAANDRANERNLHDAIRSAPKGGKLSPAAHVLACERLRRIGRIPAACRSARSDGGKAGPGR